jgi:hypothetical protein
MDEQVTPQATEVAATQGWKRHFTTVTPLSKFLAMLLFISMPFAGFGLGVKYAKDVSTPQPYVDNQVNDIRIPQANQNIDPQPNNTSSTSLNREIIVNGYRYEFSYKPDPSHPGAILNNHLIFVSSSGEKLEVPDDVWFKIYAGSAYAETGKRDGEDLTSFDMPVDPQNKDMIYLSTAEPLDKAYSRVKNRIYSYNLTTATLHEIYSEIMEAPSSWKIFRTVGIEGLKIILLRDNPDNSPGPCTDIWLGYKDQMEYLDINDPQAGLKNYIVPAYKIEEGRSYAERCLREFETNGGI